MAKIKVIDFVRIIMTFGKKYSVLRMTDNDLLLALKAIHDQDKRRGK